MLRRAEHYRAVIVAAGLVGACAARGPGYSEAAAEMVAVPDAMARIVFFRTRDSALYIARKATITVDGESAGATPYGGFHYVDVAAGAHRLRADMWDAPGQCELSLLASAGRIYYFQVDPRTESFGAYSTAGFAAGIVSNGVVSSLAGGLAGAAGESYGKTCGGAFRLYPVDPDTAPGRLADLIHSR